MTEQAEQYTEQAEKSDKPSLLYRLAPKRIKAVLNGETRHAVKKVFEADDKQVLAFPTDRWILDFTKKEYKENADFKKSILDVVKPAVGIALGLSSMAAGAVVGLVLMGGVGVYFLVASALAVLPTVLMVQKTKSAAADFKQGAFKEYQKTISQAYAKTKVSEVASDVKEDLANVAKSGLSKVKGVFKRKSKSSDADNNADAQVEPKTTKNQKSKKPSLRKQAGGLMSLANKKWKIAERLEQKALDAAQKGAPPSPVDDIKKSENPENSEAPKQPPAQVKKTDLKK